VVACNDDASDTTTEVLPSAVQRDDGSWPRMPASTWGERIETGEYRNDDGDIDEDGLWRYHSSARTWIRDRKEVSRHERAERPEHDAKRGERHEAHERAERPEHDAKRGERHEAQEKKLGGRAQARGPGGWGSARECEEIIGDQLPHVVQIAMTDPAAGPFTWPGAGEADMVPERDAVMQRLAGEFGPLTLLPSLSKSKPNVNSLRQLVDARNSGRLLLICDTETHRAGDSRGNRWMEGGRRVRYCGDLRRLEWQGAVVEAMAEALGQADQA